MKSRSNRAVKSQSSHPKSGKNTRLFESEEFVVFEFEHTPLNRDCFLMDECYAEEYQNHLLKLFKGEECDKTVGYISHVACNRIGQNSIDLSWYPNVNDRFHEVLISLPKDQIVVCVECWELSKKPHIFVKSEWLEKLYLSTYSVFCMVDAIGVKKSLENGGITREKLILLRSEIDGLGEKYPQVSFISFADSVLIKSNWTVGTYKSEINYTYHPEIFFSIIDDLRNVYKAVLNMDIYAILTQGGNEYYDDTLLHISAGKNHVSLNSLGIPFSDLMSIDNRVRRAIKNGEHQPAQLYVEERFYRSLKLRYEYKKRKTHKVFRYPSKMREEPSFYILSDVEEIKRNLENMHRVGD